MTENLEKTIARVLKIWFIYVPAIVVILFIIVGISDTYKEAKQKVAQQKIIKKNNS